MRFWLKHINYYKLKKFQEDMKNIDDQADNNSNNSKKSRKMIEALHIGFMTLALITLFYQDSRNYDSFGEYISAKYESLKQDYIKASNAPWNAITP